MSGGIVSIVADFMLEVDLFFTLNMENGVESEAGENDYQNVKINHEILVPSLGCRTPNSHLCFALILPKTETFLTNPSSSSYLLLNNY